MSELWDIYDKNRRLTGKTVERGRPMAEDEYHIVVQVWIKNSRGEWLISKRTPNKSFPLRWEPTGGSVVAGEDSLAGALREAKEELGVILSPERGRLFASRRRDKPSWENPGFLDVWIFERDWTLEDIVLQEGETCDAMWASDDDIRRLVAAGKFIPISYLGELLEREGRTSAGVAFYAADEVDDSRVKFAVVCAKYEGKWLFCRHRLRRTWEVPGGHRETGESVGDTARRELFEETGAIDFDLSPVCSYSVGGAASVGMLFRADVRSLGPLPEDSEIGEIMLSDGLPNELTYLDIQPKLFEKVIREMKL